MLLDENLLTFDYYKNLTPMYLQQSYGFLDIFKIYYDLGFAENEETTDIDGLFASNETIASENTIVGKPKYIEFYNLSIIEFIEKLFNSLDVYSKNVNKDVLYKLCNFFGISKNVRVHFYDYTAEEWVTKNLSLTDDELLLYLKCKIIQNRYDGTAKMANDLYDRVGLPIFMVTRTNNEAYCQVWLLMYDDTQFSQNIQELFLSGLLTLKSVGVRYSHRIQVATNIALFDSTDTNRGFDKGRFI